MTYCQAGNMQVLQEASKWCPDAEKVFVSPTGQLVDPAAAQQQVTAPHVNGASQPQTPGKALPEHTISCLSTFPPTMLYVQTIFARCRALTIKQR